MTADVARAQPERGRARVQVDNLENYTEADTPDPVRKPDGNLVSSEMELRPGLHMPVIDMDFPCELVPSSTPGHYHLYINTPMGWVDCVHLLDGLLAAGLIQQGWYDGCIRNGYMRVRHPDHPKPQPAPQQVVAEVPW